MEHNSVVNRYLSDNERYADFINGCEFAGAQVIRSADLLDLDTQVNATMYTSGRQSRSEHKKTKYRDIIRKIAFSVNFLVVGVENQEEVHYLMPLRIMEYDAGEYARQASDIRRQVRGKKKLTSAEFLSGFTKENKLQPCVTFVLYYGDNWDGGRELHDLLDFSDIHKELKALVNNYKIHLIEIKKLQDTSVFRTDLKQVFDFIRYSKDKKKLRELVQNDSAYCNLDEDAYDMVALCTKTKELYELKEQYRKGDKINMCQAITEMLQDEREEGRTEGRAEARIEGIEIFVLDNIEENVPRERICEKLQRRFRLSVEEAEQVYEKYANG